MAVYFSGTGNGGARTYEVGQHYSNGNGTYRANEDGSFTKLGNVVGTTDGGRVVRDNTGGQTLQGSAGNPDVRWYATGNESLASGRYSPGTAVSLTSASGGHNPPPVATPQRAGGSGGGGAAGVAAGSGGAVPMANPYAIPGRGAAAAWSPVRDAAWSGDDDPAQDLRMAGFHWVSRRDSSNAELAEIRYSDIGGNIVGLGVLGLDIGDNAARLMGTRFEGAGIPRGPELAAHRLSVVSEYANAGVDAGVAALRSAIPADVTETRHDGWVSFDGGQSWQYDGTGPAFASDPKRNQGHWADIVFEGTN
ncbi:hypothetical protein [Tortoise microvirus 72]|nr:hypothetical protein [Tortoise microvirus 72]